MLNNDPARGWVRLGDVPDPKYPPFIVEDLIHDSSTLVYGRPKSGKSWLLLSLAESLASGQPWFDRKIREQRNVAYLMLDSGQVNETKRRAKGLAPVTDDMLVSSLSPGYRPEDWRNQAALLKDFGTDILFVDNLFRLLPPRGSIRLDEDINEVLRNLKEIEDTGITLVLSHHLGKPGENGFSPTSPLGSTALEGYFRHFIRVEHNRSTGEREVVAYGNDLEVDEVRFSFQLSDEGAKSTESRDAERDRERLEMIQGKTFANQAEIGALWGVDQGQVSKILSRLGVKRDRGTGSIVPK